MTKQQDHASKESAAVRIAISAILLIAFALRIWQLDAQAFSGDEAFTIISWTRTSIDYLFTVVAVEDPQPLIALLSLTGWIHLAGDSLFAARMLSALMGTMSVAATYTLANQLFGRRIALISAVGAAINPFLIWYAQDIRSYGLWIGLSAITLAALVRAFKYPTTKNWTFYIVLAALSAYTYYLEVFMLIVHNIYALTQIIYRRSLLRSWVITQLAIGLILAPWYLQPSIRQSTYQPTAGQPDILSGLQTFLFGTTLPANVRSFSPVPTLIPPLITILVVTIIIAALIYTWRQYSIQKSVLLTAASLLPLGLLASLALITAKGYFHPRYVAGSAVPLIILLSVVLTPRQPFHADVKTITKFAGLTMLGGLALMGFISYRTDPNMAKAPRWPELVNILNEQARPNDLILRNYPDPAFTYYYTGGIEVQTLPQGENPPAEETITALSAYASTHDYIWFMPVESDAFDRERVVAKWLEANMQLVSDQQIGGIRLLQYGAWDRTQPEINFDQHPIIENTAILHGYRVTSSNTTWLRGTTLYLELFWGALAHSDQPLKVFVHLIGPSSPSGTLLWAQDDHFPQMGRLNSVNWPLGTIFPDVYRITIPLDALSGQYWITAGFYDPETGERVAVLGESNPIVADSVTVLSFDIP